MQPLPNTVEVAARVVLPDPLGAEPLVTFEIGGLELVARCSSAFAHASGTAMPVHLDQSRMHIFDAHDGMALR